MAQRVVIVHEKNAGVAVILGLLIGGLGIYGVGQMYVGKVGRGVFIMLLSWSLVAAAGFFLFEASEQVEWTLWDRPEGVHMNSSYAFGCFDPCGVRG